MAAMRLEAELHDQQSRLAANGQQPKFAGLMSPVGLGFILAIATFMLWLSPLLKSNEYST